MYAAWYDRRGAAADVLQVGQLSDPTPGPGEVRVRVSVSGINPGDTKKRSDWMGAPMPYPRVIPHSDGAGVIDQVGDGVHKDLLGRRVWVYGAQSYRAGGTAAQYTVVPADQAVPLPDAVSDEVGACLGIPGITAHRAVFADGGVTGQSMLVHGVLGAVSSMAAQLAHRAGARVIGTVRRCTDLTALQGLQSSRWLDAVVALDGDDPAAAVRDVAPDGVDRVVEVSFSDNADLDVAVMRNGAVIAAFATREARPAFPFWPMLFENTTIRLLGSDDFPAAAKQEAAADLTRAAADADLVIPFAQPLPLERIAHAHDQVDAGSRSRTLLAIPN
ncbi:NADPH:quinone reductase [Kineococcus sp. R86509]|uniref:NADPH:quinone reductase n=1 Tax=Kineococcus sp. R86509 TaxID=3093851 RepID=UPI0036D2589A